MVECAVFCAVCYGRVCSILCGLRISSCAPLQIGQEGSGKIGEEVTDQQCTGLTVQVKCSFTVLEWIKPFWLSNLSRVEYILLCTLPGRRPGIAEGNERTWLGRVHLYFFFAFVLIIVL